MKEEITFRIYAGCKSVDIKTTSRDIPIEDLLEIKKGEPPENSVYLREPDSSNPSEIRSFLTAMRGIRIVESETVDGQINISLSHTPSLNVENNNFELRLTEKLIEKPEDRRRTLAGNLGLLFSLSLYLFERKHQMVSYHSSMMVDQRNRLIFVVGGEAASGKSVVMLDFLSIHEGDSEYRVLSTEMGHFHINKNELTAYSGSFFDNISFFPRETEKRMLINKLFPGARLPDSEKNIKIPISIKDYYADKNTYSSREGFKLVYLLPDIQMGKKTKNPRLIGKDEFKKLFESMVGVARQKLGVKPQSWIYEDRASLHLPASYLGSEQKMELKTIGDSLKDNFLRGAIKIEGTPVDFNRKPGEYWKRIGDLLCLY